MRCRITYPSQCPNEATHTIIWNRNVGAFRAVIHYCSEHYQFMKVRTTPKEMILLKERER